MISDKRIKSSTEIESEADSQFYLLKEALEVKEEAKEQDMDSPSKTIKITKVG